MEGKLNTLTARMVLVVLLIHAVLLPALFFGVVALVGDSLKEFFIDDVRVHSRIVADIFESTNILDTEASTIAELDSVVLGGQITYAALLTSDRLITSSIMDQAESESFNEDFSFGEHEDKMYFVSVPVATDTMEAVLRLGFDEAPTFSSIEQIKLNVFYVLLAYLAITLLMVGLFSGFLIRPIRRLQKVSRKIASGNYDQKMQDKSSLYEIRELAADLEVMRRNLVGINARLQREISDHKTSEAERKNLEARLQHAQRLESLGTLAGGVAHEFNNVLQPLLLYTDLALEDLPDDSPIAANMQRVLELANRAKGLSHQILTFGRRGDDVVFEELPITPIVEEAVTMIRALLPATVDIRASIERDAGNISCDPAQIQQLVVNLCNNAFQALATGRGHIGVALEQESVTAERATRHPNLHEGQYVVLEVADTGHGMSAETVARIFEPFFTTQEVGEGTGLGLSVVHGIVMRHNGEILISSSPGEGTKIRIYLPLADGMGENSNGKR